MLIVRSLQFALLCALVAPVSAAAEFPPPDSPATVSVQGNRLELTYDGSLVFSGIIRSGGSRWRWHEAVDSREGIVTQAVSIVIAEGESLATLDGRITGSEEAFPCEVDRPPKGLDVVRNSFGLSASLANRAVYDRKSDWVLSVDYYAGVRIEPEHAGKESIGFHLAARGREIILRFQPLYFQKHRGLKYFQPWTYDVWKKPVVGWCSWFAYHDDIDEKTIKHVADVLAATLKPYGYEYLQIDDGYQRGQGLPDLWLHPNQKFPDGLADLASAIGQKGLSPGIWTNVAFNQHDFASQHKDWFVLDDSGQPASGNWIDLSIDGSNHQALDSIVRPVYRELRKTGWRYFKVDALRHLRYEGYNSHGGYFKSRRIDPVEAYRAVALAIRDEIGRDRYMLGCWGIRPELIGIIDGCRIGDDGFSYAGMAQYNSFNNIVWRNDPDHVELSASEAYRSTMVTSLTGSVLMLTDKPEKYLTPLVEPARRAAPVLFTLPGQLYDVDPSRSSALGRVNSEMSGSGPRPFDAGYVPRCNLFALEINKPYERWLVLGRTGGSFKTISFADLGLAADREYLIFEYWSRRLLGKFTREFPPGELEPQFNCQLFCIREVQPHPQLIATSRHISCGGFELERLAWEGDALAGESMLVANDPYDIYLTEPPGTLFRTFECDGAKVLSTEKRESVRICRLLSPNGGHVSWKAEYASSQH